MRRRETEPFARYRSLLQKAVRRGNAQLVITTCALLAEHGQGERRWVRERAAVITFEEAWPLGRDLVFNQRYHSKVAILVRASRSQKAKDAAGLGSLALALLEKDRSVLTDTAEDRHLRIVADAIRRPDAFWEWVREQATTRDQSDLIQNAYRFRHAALPRDTATTKAAAYLAVVSTAPELERARIADAPFPYWTAFDRHTTEGRRALKDIARDLHIHLPQLEWVHFFMEGAVFNDLLPSPWWDRYCRWRFAKAGMPMEEAHLLWDPVRPQVMDALAEDGNRLHKDIYRWKMDNRGRIRQLEQQVELFLDHFENVRKDQLGIFESEP